MSVCTQCRCRGYLCRCHW
ncbi:hypothetical protein FEF09_29480 [Chitinophaga pinensis]|uniref:Uncharacterized protein n=1 Tax=Chitinophaga pinensis TaxID=79329 RepID=A0A5C6LKJ5_9BACT|nr:hypothetical protein FEF09_29480 [Chitinophaga pinensis]